MKRMLYLYLLRVGDVGNRTRYHYGMYDST